VRLDTSETVNLRKCLILLDSCQIHAKVTAYQTPPTGKKGFPFDRVTAPVGNNPKMPFQIWVILQ
jgi:hypothetical protein